MKKLACLMTLACSLAALAAAPARPNLIVILVDDMGFSDVSCYGGEIPTPNIEALAKNGIRFTQFYNTARCCPTRAALLTGLYPHQAGVGHMTEDKGEPFPGYRGRLNERCVTIAEVLRPAGYFTAMTGKWHVGGTTPEMWPLQHGFDRFYGSPEGGGFYFKPKTGRSILLNNEKIFDADSKMPEGWYSTDMWVEYGIKFIDEALAQKQPFFLHLAHNAPHFPLQAPPEEISRWRGRYQEGWDKLREQRFQRQLALGLIDKQWPMSPRDKEVEAWDKLSNEQKDKMDHIMAIYAAVVEHMDRSIGTLMKALKQRNILNNTAILFMSDNGGNAESGIWGRYEGQEPGSADSTIFCGQSWANLQNTPFRQYKHYVHEGGISSPLIAHWPDGIPAKLNGTFCHQPGHVIDIMATCADLAGATYPGEHQGRTITPLEGRSLAPLLRGENRPVHDAIYWEHEGNRAIREGDWKLVAKGAKAAWELYNLKDDRTELSNLADKMPDKAKDLATKWEAWAKHANVRPAPGEGGAAKKKSQKKN